ncbi:MAG: transposase [Comamonadaceae bacterium]|nr:transposase [Comamonadaceae bacterium]
MDESIKNLGLTVLKSPPHSPQANAICERVIGTIRRECLDWLIPLSEPHLRSMLKEWVTHYNGARPHMALGPGVPDPPAGAVLRANEKSRHRLGARARGVRPLGAGRLTSRVFARARTGLIEYLRSTTIPPAAGTAGRMTRTAIRCARGQGLGADGLVGEPEQPLPQTALGRHGIVPLGKLEQAFYDFVVAENSMSLRSSKRLPARFI